MSWTPNTQLERTPFENLSPEQQATWKAVDGASGQAVHVEVFAQHQAVEDFYVKEFYPRFVFNSESDMLVDVKDKELFRFRMGKLHGCQMCNSFNVQSVRAAGYGDEQIDNILDPTPEHFSDKELAIIELADQFLLQNLDAYLTPELHARLRMHYSDAQILELGMIGAFFMGWQRLLFAFDLVPREDACPLPVPVA
jgi:hypothetical protein